MRDRAPAASDGFSSRSAKPGSPLGSPRSIKQEFLPGRVAQGNTSFGNAGDCVVAPHRAATSLLMLA